MYKRAARIPLLRRPADLLGERLWLAGFERDLVKINSVLQNTALADHYWIWGGLLLGWAREGRILMHDDDADFGVRRADFPRLMSAVPDLTLAGFRPYMQLRNIDGAITELVFLRKGRKYEFFVLDPMDSDLRYYTYGWVGESVQIEGRIPDQPLDSFNFLGCTWKKPADHELELTAIYGNWRTPNMQWSYLDDEESMVTREPWVCRDFVWNGK